MKPPLCQWACLAFSEAWPVTSATRSVYESRHCCYSWKQYFQLSVGHLSHPVCRRTGYRSPQSQYERSRQQSDGSISVGLCLSWVLDSLSEGHESKNFLSELMRGKSAPPRWRKIAGLWVVHALYYSTKRWVQKAILWNLHIGLW